jgi:hypothetical protein
MVTRVVGGVSITPDTEALPGSVQHTPHLVGGCRAGNARSPREIDTSGVLSAGKPSGVDLALADALVSRSPRCHERRGLLRVQGSLVALARGT